VPIVALSRSETHTLSRTAKFRGAFANHFNVKWLVMAGSKDSPGVARSIEHWHDYRFFTPPANAGYALFVDVDRPEAVTEIFERIPAEIAPSWVIDTPKGAQAGWFIDPVDLRENARSHPIRYARNVGKALRHAVGGDPLVDPLTPSRVRNPAYEPAGTFASPTPPIYKLGELHKALKAAGLWYSEPLKFAKSGRPAAHTTAGNLQVGNRNKGIFDAARFVAYDEGDYVAKAWDANDRCVIPLKPNEVHVIINSIARHMATNGYTRAKGPTTALPEPLRRALSEMGRRGGLANTAAQRAARAKGPAAAAAARKHRTDRKARTAQHLRRKGHSRAQIAAKLRCHPSTISRYLRRWIPMTKEQIQACITGASGGARYPRLLPHTPAPGTAHLLHCSQCTNSHGPSRNHPVNLPAIRWLQTKFFSPCRS
jgi:DNA-binding CsgD family transcriptional regulator